MAIETPSAAFATPSNNGTVTYTYPFNNSKFEDDDVFVYLYNTTTGDYDVQTVTDDYAISGNTITFTEAPTTQVLILRRTDFNALKIPNFTPGSSIRGQDLDSNFTQLLRVQQEFRDLKVDKFFPEVRADLDMNSQRISELGDATTDTDAVTRGQLAKVITDDLVAGDCITLTDAVGGTNSGDRVTVGVTDGTITSAKITDGTIVNVDVNDNANIHGSKLADGTITSAKITDGTIVNADINASADIDGSKLLDNSIDLTKVKGIDKAVESEYATTWAGDDDQIATVGALSKRYDVEQGTSAPTNTQPGKFWLNNTVDVNSLNMWNGSTWQVLTSGTPYIPQGTTIVRYVDAVNGSDDATRSGFLPQSPLKTIKRALTLVNASSSGDGTLIVVEPGVYQEALPLTIEKNNVSVVGKSLRSCFIHPTVATENNNMWEVDSGTYISGFTMLGLKVPTSDQGSRNNSIDNDATYGLPSNQPFAVSFRSGDPVILKSPYVQNCTHFSDAHFDNANFDPNTFPSTDSQTYSAVAGDETSAPCGGGLLVDGSVPASTSPIRSMVVDAFTQITLDGPGILVTNNGYAQLVSFFGTFCHYHAKAKNGGQINLSNCVTDFGRYGLIAEGKSPTAIASATASAANSGATTVTIGAITSAQSFHGTVSRPLDHMMLTVDGNDYGVVSSVANGSGWDVTITPALSQAISNTAVTFALRSYISTGGHTFEYVGVGTDYSDHPDQGGVAIEANQVKEISGGKVWQSSTDHIGKFKAGSVLTVDQIAETLAVNGNITVTGTNSVNGNITVTGTVDGRDVATDGTKLDGIEAGADVTDATNVDAAGAVMNSDSSSAAMQFVVDEDNMSSNSATKVPTQQSVKAYVDAEVAGVVDSAPGALDTLNELAAALGDDANFSTTVTNSIATKLPLAGGTMTGNITMSGSQTVDGRDLSVDGSKLDGIATGATAYANSDVDAHLNRSTASSGELLSWNGSDYDWIAAASSYSDSSVDSHLNRSTAASGEVLSFNGSDYDWVAQSTGGLTDNSNDSTSLGVGTNALDSETSGTNNSAFGVNALTATTTGHTNTAVGKDALQSNTTGQQNVAVGYGALDSNTSGYLNTALGTSALYSNTTGNENTAIGWGAGKENTTGYNITAVGFKALHENTTGHNNVAVGNSCLFENTTGTKNSALGVFALRNLTTGINNVGAGYEAARSITTGNHNTSLGQGAGYAITTGSQNVCIGRETGDLITTGSNNLVLGYKADPSSATVNNEITLGDANITSLRIPGLQSGASDGQVLTYNSSNGNITLAAAGGVSNNATDSTSIGIGPTALDSETSGERNIALGQEAGTAISSGRFNTLIGDHSGELLTTQEVNTAVGSKAGRNGTGTRNVFLGADAGVGVNGSSSGGSNIFIGNEAGKVYTTANNSTVVGTRAGQSLTTGNNNSYVGNNAGRYTTTGGTNTALGASSMQSNTTGGNNTATGYEALKNNTTGVKNTAIGYKTLDANTTASYNTAIGDSSLGANTTGQQNVAIGYRAGDSITSGANNVVIGYNADASSATVSNEITLGDANITSLRIPGLQDGASNGQVLTYNSSNGNITLADAGGGLSSTSSGSQSIGVGNHALSNETGNNNTAFGFEALKENTSGEYNSALGSEAGLNLTTGQKNIAVGYQALRSATNASSNICVGYQTGYDITSGESNVLIGTGAGRNIESGDANIAVGYETLYDCTGDGNVAIGNRAGNKITTAENLTFIGKEAGQNTTTASNVVGVGFRALQANTTGYWNTAVGNSALKANTTGNRNVVVGTGSLESNTTGSWNVAVGSGTLEKNTTGDHNVGLGHEAFYNNTTGEYNVGVGNSALLNNTTAERNTAVGHEALKSNTTNHDNTAVGYQALEDNTTGRQNTAVGSGCLNKCTVGINNTAVGFNALADITNGEENIGIGNNTLTDTSTGYRNIAIGYKAAEENNVSDRIAIGNYTGQNAGAETVFIGNNAGKGSSSSSISSSVGIGQDALKVVTSYGNVAIGSQAGSYVTSGQNNVFIGRTSGAYSTNLATGSNNILIGFNSAASSSSVSNEITLGNSSISTLRCNTQTISSLSDGRDKTEVEDLPLGLDFIDTLRPVKFKWDTRDGNGKDGSYEAGFIAQDLQSAQSTSNADYLKMVMDENPDRLEAAYGQLIPVLVQAIKDLKSEIETLKSNG